jgi:hypothetical protein
MRCPHCDDPKQGEFSGIGVRCKACRKLFYAAKNGIGYVSAPWYPWLLALALPLAGGGVYWGVARFTAVGDYVQVLRILVTLAVVLGIAESIRDTPRSQTCRSTLACHTVRQLKLRRLGHAPTLSNQQLLSHDPAH